MSGAYLLVDSGESVKERFALKAGACVIGRHPDCDLVLEAGAVSRQHAQLSCEDGVFYIEDLKSRNRTYLNREVIRCKTRLRNRDTIEICGNLIHFHGSTDDVTSDSSKSTTWSEPIRIDDLEGSDLRFNVVEPSREPAWSLGSSVTGNVVEESASSTLRDALTIISRTEDQNHLHLRLDITETEIRGMLDARTGKLAERLRHAFHRIVVLDAADGLIDDEFRQEAFLRHVKQRLSEAFELDLSSVNFHPEEVSQVLKDEPRSLFCIVNVGLVPSAMINKTLRGFTQEKHQVLLCGASELPRDSARRHLRTSHFSSSEVQLNAVLEITQSIGSGLTLDEVLPRILNGLFQVFRQSDQAVVALLDSGGVLTPRFAKVRREEWGEDPRVSKSIFRAVVESKTAAMSSDAMSDERWSESGSVASQNIRSVMCAPLIDSRERVLGAIQVDTLDAGKKFSASDLEVFVALTGAASIFVSAAKMRERQLHRLEYERDLNVARDVHRSFLPTERPLVPGYEFTDCFEPGVGMSGDYFDYVPLPDGRLVIVVADIVGVGVSAALRMARLSSDVRFALASHPNVVDAVSMLNYEQCHSRHAGLTTMAVLTLDPERHQVSLINCGHLPPILIQAGTNVWESERSGVPLGIIDDFQYDEQTADLRPNDAILLFTDGLCHAHNADDELLGVDRVRRIVAENSRDIFTMGARLVAAFTAHIGARPCEDDMCFVALRRNN